jgi:Peptidase C39 family
LDSLGWFTALAALAVLGFCAGHRLGRGPAYRAWASLAMSLLLLFVWSWLERHPAVAVNAIPPHVLSYLEGAGGVPFFMFIIGVAWSRSRLPRQRRVTALAAVMGTIYFLQGSLWMIQTTPSSALGQSPGRDRRSVVMQSADFTCVPAACATALNRLGVPTTEADMAELTQARPGTGATIVRAMDGLERRLAGYPIRVELVEPDYMQLTGLPMPALTPLRVGPTQRHMVVLTHVDDVRVSLIDPQDGRIAMTRREFEQVYEGQVLAFRR